MADEMVDIVDKNNIIIGKDLKSEAHRKGLWHRAAHIWIYNSKKEMLLQLRAKEKELFPDRWDIGVAGHIGAGEDPETTALRELKEEIGLSITKDRLEFVNIRKESHYIREDFVNNEFAYVYLLKYDGDINNLKLQKEEVNKIEFIPTEQVEQELKSSSEKFVPHGEYWFDIIKKIKQKF